MKLITLLACSLHSPVLTSLGSLLHFVSQFQKTRASGLCSRRNVSLVRSAHKCLENFEMEFKFGCYR
ncbi:hypothetical protein M758_6G028600 [Ceratodon purpureus]|uniref:Secreted protein n=1 Tax=Ceratodon purpureus TaxID=3225 RepID=A0A8T0HBE1_CERPU|nr:hypothetical protein KC19_6G031500 [Ceratodon purpureus]KAG0612447.1 hypothetical protein M758_6G028600 [Ceratodon purpureus]